MLQMCYFVTNFLQWIASDIEFSQSWVIFNASKICELVWRQIQYFQVFQRFQIFNRLQIILIQVKSLSFRFMFSKWTVLDKFFVAWWWGTEGLEADARVRSSPGILLFLFEKKTENIGRYIFSFLIKIFFWKNKEKMRK